MMLRRIWKAVVTVYYWLSIAFVVLVALWLELVIPRFLWKFHESVVLPNGMVLRRQFDFSFAGRDDLFAPDGQTLLVRGVDMICFNDRYTDVVAMHMGKDGIFDALSPDGRLHTKADLRVAEASLSGGRGCNGYYTGMIGANYFYKGGRAPFLPPCNWRNFANPALRHKDWLLRPCSQDSSAPQAQRGGEDLPPANFP